MRSAPEEYPPYSARVLYHLSTQITRLPLQLRCTRGKDAANIDPVYCLVNINPLTRYVVTYACIHQPTTRTKNNARISPTN